MGRSVAMQRAPSWRQGGSRVYWRRSSLLTVILPASPIKFARPLYTMGGFEELKAFLEKMEKEFPKIKTEQEALIYDYQFEKLLDECEPSSMTKAEKDELLEIAYRIPDPRGGIADSYTTFAVSLIDKLDNDESSSEEEGQMGGRRRLRRKSRKSRQQKRKSRKSRKQKRKSRKQH